MLLKLIAGGIFAGIFAIAYGYTEYKRSQDTTNEEYEEGITEMEKASIIADKVLEEKKKEK